MLGVKPKAPRMSSPAKRRSAVNGAGGSEAAAAWELRPGGMLVQKRNSDSNQSSVPIPNIRVKVKYGSFYHDINISSQASFGDLKKLLAGPTKLNPLDQKLIYKDKERDSKAYLDVAGIKDGSKIVLIEDVISREKRVLESRKNANLDKATKEIAGIGLEVDQLAKQVANLELEIYGGKKVAETVLLNLIELLMTQLIKLDGIIADGDVKLKRRMQVKRVQKYIETLDVLKVRNSKVEINGDGAKVPLQRQNKIFTGEMRIPIEKQQNQYQNRNQNQRNLNGNNMARSVVVTTEWETFDSGAVAKLPFTPPMQSKHNVPNASSKQYW